MLHDKVLDISFSHYSQIQSVTQNIVGKYDIDHFSLDLVNGKNEMLFLSSTPAHAFEICSRGLSQYDGITSPEYYKKYEFYWWKTAKHQAFSDEINDIRREIFGFTHGFMLVRHWDDYYLIYSFATKSHDPDFETKITNSLNQLLALGDSAYYKLYDIYQLYTDMNPPIIQKFYPFEGGIPPRIYTKAPSFHTSSKFISIHQYKNG